MKSPVPGGRTGAALVVILAVIGAACTEAVPAPTNPTPVLPTAKSAVTSLILEGTPPSVGTSSPFTATAVFANGLRVNVSNETQWVARNPTRANVAPDGRVSGVGLGPAEVIARFQTFATSQRMLITGPGKYFMYISDPGDPVGGGNMFGVTGSVTGSRRAANRAEFFGDQGEPVGTLRLDLAAPEGQPLEAGTYEGAGGYPNAPANRPALRLRQFSAECPDLDRTTGRFVIHEIQYSGSTVSRVWATFEQYCSGSPIGLRGEIAINRQ